MKFLLFFIFIFVLSSCSSDDSTKIESGVSYKIIVIDSCQYINWTAPYSNSIVHKGNCNNPIHYESH